MLKEERLRLILDKIGKDRKVLLSDLSRDMKVSEDTVRRDIKDLSVKRLLKEVRGGAIPHAPGPYNFRDRENFASRQKQQMAKKAVQLLRNGQVVIMDSGTSVMAVATLLPKNLSITIVTNSFPIVGLLEERKDIEIYFGGGRVLRESNMTAGQDAVNFFKEIRADICLLGVCSIDLELGLTGHHYDESAVKKQMIKSSGQTVALTTPEKLNTAEAFHIAPINALTGIITPSPDIDLLQPYKKAGINIM